MPRKKNEIFCNEWKEKDQLFCSIDFVTRTYLVSRKSDLNFVSREPLIYRKLNFTQNSPRSFSPWSVYRYVGSLCGLPHHKAQVLFKTWPHCPWFEVKSDTWSWFCKTSCYLLTGGNWQKWKRVFLTCPCHEIYRDEAVGLKSCKYTRKITKFVKMGNLGQYRENFIFCQ